MANDGGKLWGAAIGGGIAGALLTAGAGLLALQSGAGDRLVRSALLRHPDMLVETADALRDRQYAPVLAAQRAAVETPFGSSWQGAAKPEVTLVEFYDYACTYCRASLPAIAQLLKEDKGLRVVYRELPILGPQSVEASRVALAASQAGRFKQFHDAMYNAGRPAPETIAVAAKAAGVPATANQDPAHEAELRKNFQLAGQLGATGTPLFIVGDRVMNGAVGYEVLKKAIGDARAGRS
ncbi:DsbA family protein [Sphingomonas ginkgonis]|uniref:DsbA family protein n=1 Tax=Sphingomonas ginkgonis TaxID=2315330 RepID=A0A429VD39_9SPHN|nr:DsbA family protein [Sphingomonas ginkgonis]RST31919.1 DsbA family protein [Sphingomonas ginkgonis]